MTIVKDRLGAFNALYEGLSSARIIEHAAATLFPGKIAIVSSFGAESAVLLHLAAAVDPGIPVLFLDTNKLFGETLRYRSRLQHLLGLEDVRVIGPRKRNLETIDPHGTLSMHDPDECCRVRKTEPLERSLKGFDCWISGRKRHQTSFRTEMKILEFDGERHKLNPLALWTRKEIGEYFTKHNLPEHPLMRHGYLSVGCMPCTSKLVDEEDARSGRWAGQAKTECGIHMPKKGS